MKRYRTFQTALGPATIAVDDDGRVTDLKTGSAAFPAAVRDLTVGRDAERQLSEYLSGERTTFELNLAPQGTAFQRRVWQLLLEIPFGETRTYGQLAKQLGDESLARAVGAANGANPIWIVVPCHRVIGANGSLTGYAGGLEVKRRLLELERGRAVQARLF